MQYRRSFGLRPGGGSPRAPRFGRAIRPATFAGKVHTPAWRQRLENKHKGEQVLGVYSVDMYHMGSSSTSYPGVS